MACPTAYCDGDWSQSKMNSHTPGVICFALLRGKNIEEGVGRKQVAGSQSQRTVRKKLEMIRIRKIQK